MATWLALFMEAAVLSRTRIFMWLETHSRWNCFWHSWQHGRVDKQGYGFRRRYVNSSRKCRSCYFWMKELSFTEKFLVQAKLLIHTMDLVQLLTTWGFYHNIASSEDCLLPPPLKIEDLPSFGRTSGQGSTFFCCFWWRQQKIHWWGNASLAF